MNDSAFRSVGPTFMIRVHSERIHITKEANFKIQIKDCFTEFKVGVQIGSEQVFVLNKVLDMLHRFG